jgi:hypothetical protein
MRGNQASIRPRVSRQAASDPGEAELSGGQPWLLQSRPGGSDRDAAALAVRRVEAVGPTGRRRVDIRTMSLDTTWSFGDVPVTGAGHHGLMACEIALPALSDARVVLRGWARQDAAALEPACGAGSLSGHRHNHREVAAGNRRRTPRTLSWCRSRPTARRSLRPRWRKPTRPVDNPSTRADVRSSPARADGTVVDPGRVMPLTASVRRRGPADLDQVRH